MSQTHLTHKYRPQRFAEVAGQDVIKSILSRAAQTGAVAPAYMFSGTRGVGKTTIARIFAKALNCENGPAAEPCNECSHCRQIQAGAAVDVMEIDGASHTGVDNVRSLKEDVGFAPIDCRYKVFIIDEAHMLSKGAFNALLKTLEEPPSHATFIMATTEPHKFPPTIISRCQHYTFQRLAQKELETHLEGILNAEGLAYDADALALVARRGAGSVRDSMSLMGQVLALGGERLTSADVRQVLGLAGRDIVFRLLAAVHGRDCLAILDILREIMDQGLDLGFFLRELTESWRTMFLLAQSGDAALGVLDIPDDEAAQWREMTAKFHVAHIHACWQMTLEGQQRVKSSLEPALALELLLLNLAYLPQLMPLGDIAATGEAPPPSAAPAPAAPASPAQGAGGPPPAAAGQQGAARDTAPRPAANGAREREAESESEDPAPARVQDPLEEHAAPPPPEDPGGYDPAADFDPGPDPRDEPSPAPYGTSSPPPAAPRETAGAARPAHNVPVPDGPRTWSGFKRFAEAVQAETGRGLNGIAQADGQYADGALRVDCLSGVHKDQLRKSEAHATLVALVEDYFGPGTDITFHVPERKRVDRKTMREDALRHPVIESLIEELDARVLDVRPAGE